MFVKFTATRYYVLGDHISFETVVAWSIVIWFWKHICVIVWILAQVRAMYNMLFENIINTTAKANDTTDILQTFR